MDSKPEDQTEKKDWAEMSDDEAENETAEAAEETQSKPEPEPKKIIPPTQKGTKNKQGDYIVEKFEIPDFRDGMKKKDQNDSEDEDDDSSDDYGNEDDNANNQAEEAPKKEGKIFDYFVLDRCQLMTSILYLSQIHFMTLQ